MKYKGIKKLYYSISEISEKLGIKASVIRYWETEFKDLKPQKNRAGNRIYKEDDIDLIRLIHHYVYEKHLSIHDANDLIQDLKREHLYKRKVKELSVIPPTPMLEEETEIDPIDEIEEDVIAQLPELDTFEENEVKHNIPFDEGFTIVSKDEKLINKPEPLIKFVPEDEKKVEPLKSQASFDFEIVSPSKETFMYPLDEQNEEDDDDAENHSLSISLDTAPIPEPPVISEPVKKVDPEIKQLLKKISSNINDIIGILNE